MDEAIRAIQRQLEVERLFAYEAWLLDERRFDDWLLLFTDDATYSVAAGDSGQDQGRPAPRAPAGSVPLFVDDKAFLTARIRRLETRLAHAEQPPSMTRHLITNVLIHGEPGPDQVEASTNFVVFQSRIDVSDHVFFGKRDDTLRLGEGGWRIARRQVLLDRTPLPGVLSILL